MVRLSLSSKALIVRLAAALKCPLEILVLLTAQLSRRRWDRMLLMVVFRTFAATGLTNEFSLVHYLHHPSVRWTDDVKRRTNTYLIAQ